MDLHDSLASHLALVRHTRGLHHPESRSRNDQNARRFFGVFFGNLDCDLSDASADASIKFCCHIGETRGTGEEDGTELVE